MPALVENKAVNKNPFFPLLYSVILLAIHKTHERKKQRKRDKP